MLEKRNGGVLIFFAFAAFSTSGFSVEKLEGKVVSVADGDTLTILQSGDSA